MHHIADLISIWFTLHLFTFQVASDEDEDEEDGVEEEEEEDEAMKPKGGRMQGTLVTVKMISHWSKALEVSLPLYLVASRMFESGMQRTCNTSLRTM